MEGITSPDGIILGKMRHLEIIKKNAIKNVAGVKDQKLFEAGVNYRVYKRLPPTDKN